MLWYLNLPWIVAQQATEVAAKVAAEPPAEGGMSIVFKLLLAVGVVAGSFIGGTIVARALRLPDYSFRIGLVLFTLIASMAVNIAGWPPKRGIDLSGGVVLVYEVEKGASSPALLQNTVDQINQRLSGGDGPKLAARASGANQVEIDVPEGADLAAAEKRIAAVDVVLKSAGKRSEPGKTVLVYTVDPRSEKTVEMDKLITAVGKRINPSGVKELTIRRYGADQIEVIVPEVEEREVDQIKRKISTSGLLEFRITANKIDDKELIKAAQKSVGRDVYIGGRLVGRWVQAGPDLFVPDGEYRETPSRGREILVRIDPFDVDGRYLNRASQGFDQRGGLAVDFSFDAEGGRKFGELTGRNLPDTTIDFFRHLGIVLDNVMLSAPTINSTIYGQGQISGSFTAPEIEFLIGVLNAGSLPASLRPEPISQQRISSQLGDDTIRSGTMAIVISTVSVLVFMAVYYRFAGVVADVAVVLNMIVTVALMILIKAAFTLPGLAGLVLTVGMAVDANVLIYERMREETERGASLRMAIRNGYARAMATIIDSHVTTLASAVVLYMVGTDQIKGFAVTLIIGLLMSLFTAVYVSRVIFDVAERKRWLTKINFMHLIGHTDIDFIRWRTPAIIGSLVIITVGVVATVARGPELLDIDFTGGSSVQVLFAEDKPHDIAAVRAAVAELPDVAVSSVGEDRLAFKVDTSEPDIKKVQATLQEKFPGELRTYHMSVGPLAMIEAKPAEPAKDEATKEEATKDEAAKPAETKSSDEAKTPAASEAKPAEAPAADSAPPKAEEPAPDEAPKSSVIVGRQTLEIAAADNQAAVAELVLAQADETPAQEKSPEKSEPAAQTPADTKAATDATPAPATTAPTVTSPTGTSPPAATEAMEGGTRVTLTFPQEISYTPLREMVQKALDALEIKDAIFELKNPDYQLGSDARYHEWILETTLPKAQTEALLNRMQTTISETPVFPSSNQIGGKVAGATQLMALYAILASMAIIVVYVWIRFQNVIFGLAAVVALVHDVLVTVAFLALSYYLSPYLGFLQVDPFKISLSVLAALLTIIGFSINDTIVVFDRIREVRGKSTDLTEHVINLSVNQTLSRTLLTSGTVFIASIILYFVGGPGIHGFAYSMVIGVIAGTYSSIYIAAPILLWLRKPSTQPAGANRAAAAAGGLSAKNR
jgi:SecD/SecF fusion protein